VAALIATMVVVSIAGSAYWRPEPRARETLELGGATPVRLAPSAAADTIANVLEMLARSVAFLTVPDMGRSGSGVVVHEAGFVVTNAHVVEGVERLRVAFDSGEEYEAVVWGVDRATDLAVVKVMAQRPLPAASLGDSDALQVGEFVLALGAPFGLEATATNGIVSGLHRSGLGIARFEDFIVTDAPINRGNSGGPLVNLRAEVVGINTAIIAGENSNPHNLGTFAGVGFAIPVNVMRVVAQRLIGDGVLAPGGQAGEAGAGSPGDASGDASDGPPGDVSDHASEEVRGGAGSNATAVGFSIPRDPPVATTMREATVSEPLAVGAPVAVSTAPMAATAGYVKAFDERGNAANNGTGFLLQHAAGTYFVTNEHVVADAAFIEVFFNLRPESTSLRLPATVLVADQYLDLALLQLSDTDHLVPLRLGDPDGVAVGQQVSAVGARVPERGSLTLAHNHGEIVAVDNVVLRGVARRAKKIATSVEVEIGDSGGPLLDADGDVLGVIVGRDNNETAAAEGGRRSYAVLLRQRPEIELLLKIAADPGMEIGSNYANNAGQPLILLLNVADGGLMDSIGLQDGDKIVAVNGEPVPAEDLDNYVWFVSFLRHDPGEVLQITYLRDDADGEGEERTTPLTVPPRDREP
jgi:S1-C subfamily serine protease